MYSAPTPCDARGRIYDSIVDTVGNTPLVRLPRLSAAEGLHAELLAKLEFCNPLSSVKDRIARAMIEAAEQAGEIHPERTTLIEPTSGNTGIGLAFIAAARGYRLILTMPESMSLERRKILSHLGAELVLTAASDGIRGAIARADELLEKIPNSYRPGQFENPANPEVHRRTTAEEIWQDTDGHVDGLVSGVGTGGTLSGVAEVLKTRNPDFHTVAVEPSGSAILSGNPPGRHTIQGIGPGFIPDTLDTRLIDEVIAVDDADALATARLLARLEGIPAGISSGAAIWAAIQVARRTEQRGRRFVVVLPSAAERYLSTPLFAPDETPNGTACDH